MSEIHNSPQVPLSMTGFPLHLCEDQSKIGFDYYIYLFTISAMFTAFTIFNLYLVNLNLFYYESFLYLLFLV